MQRGKIFLFGSILVGIITILIVYFSLGATGVIRTQIRDITITSTSISKEYDGLELSSNKIYDVEGLYEGDYVECSFTGSQLNVGTSENKFDAIIYDKMGTDVTDNYNINYVYGILNVSQRYIFANIRSAENFYTGNPFVVDETHYITPTNFNGYSSKLLSTIGGSGLLKNHRMEIKIFGNATMPNESNKLSVVFDVYDENSQNISSNYTLAVNTAENQPTVNIKQFPLTIKTPNYSKDYDGTPLSMDSYLGNKFSILESSQLQSGDEVKVTFTEALLNYGLVENDCIVSVFDKDGNDVTKKYDIEKKLGLLQVNKRPIYTSYSKNINYTGSAYELDFKDVKFDAGTFDLSAYTITGDLAYKDTNSHVIPGKYEVDINNLNIFDSESNSVLDNFEFKCLVKSNNLPNENALTINPININFKAKPLTPKTYDGNEYLLTIDNFYVIGNLINGHEFVLSFKELKGDLEVDADLINAGEHTYTLKAEVIDFNGNNVSELYDINKDNLSLEIKKRKVFVDASLKRNMYEYTGEEFDLTTVTCNSNLIGLIDSHSYNYFLTSPSTIKDTGEYKIIYNVIINDENNIDVTDNYEIDEKILDFEITKVKIKIEIINYMPKIEYDGMEHRVSDSNYRVVGNIVLDDRYTLDVKEDGSRPDYINVGKHTYTLDLIFKNSNGNTVDYYDVTTTTIDQEITKVKIKIEIINYMPKIEYDGMEHMVSDSNYKVVGNIVLDDKYTLDVKEDGSRPDYINVGKHTYTLDLIFENSKGNTVDYYDVTTTTIDQEITKCFIIVESASYKKEYDGETLTYEKINFVNNKNIAPNVDYNVEYLSEITNVGTVDNKFKITFGDILNEYNYDITYRYGTLEITKRLLSIISLSASKVADGHPLLCEDYKLYGELALDDALKLSDFKSITNVGKETNSYIPKIVNNLVDVTYNYLLDCHYGVLEVFENPNEIKGEIIIKPNVISKKYDGNPYTGKGNGITVTGFVDELKNYTVSNSSTIIINFPNNVAAGRYSTSIDVTKSNIIICDENNNEVTDKIQITYDYGSLYIYLSQISFEQTSVSMDYTGESYSLDLIGKEVKTSYSDSVYGFDSLNYRIEYQFDNDVTEITMPGYIVKRFTAQIFDNSGTDVTNQFLIKYKYAYLFVRKAVLTIASSSCVLNQNEEVYEKLLYNGQEYTVDELNQELGINLNITFTGRQEGTGQSDNTFVINNISDIEKIYIIMISYGKLSKI